MHGNTFEWCRDWFHLTLPGGTDPDLYSAKASATRSEHGDISRVGRGGCWADDGWPCRSAFRALRARQALRPHRLSGRHRRDLERACRHPTTFGAGIVAGLRQAAEARARGKVQRDRIFYLQWGDKPLYRRWTARGVRRRYDLRSAYSSTRLLESAGSLATIDDYSH